MVQIIPREPGLAELLGSGLGQGFMGERQRQQSLKDRLLQEESALQRQMALQEQKSQYDLMSKLALERQKAADRSALLGQLGFGGGVTQSESDILSMLSGKDIPSSILGMEPTRNTLSEMMQRPQKGSPFDNISESQLAGLAVQFPQLANLIQKQREQSQGERRYQEKKSFEEEKFRTQKEEAAWNYIPIKKYIENLDERVESARMQLDVADEIEKVLATGKVGPGNARAFLASQFGESLPFLFDENTSRLKLLEKLQAKGLKEYFPRPTEKEFFFINAAQAQLGKTDVANQAVIDLQRKFAQIPIRAAEFKDQIIEENGGFPPRDLQSRVNKRMDEYNKTLIKDSASISLQYGDKEEKKEALSYLKQNLPKNKVMVRLPDGQIGSIDRSKLDLAKSRGAEEL